MDEEWRTNEREFVETNAIEDEAPSCEKKERRKQPTAYAPDR